MNSKLYLWPASPSPAVLGDTPVPEPTPTVPDALAQPLAAFLVADAAEKAAASDRAVKASALSAAQSSDGASASALATAQAARATAKDALHKAVDAFPS